MPLLPKSEIAARIALFVEAHKEYQDEHAQSVCFLKNFFECLGVAVEKVGVFEHRVNIGRQQRGYIDLFLPGKMLIEMKSRGEDLGNAYLQALCYANHLPRQAGEPKYILVCDFWRWHLYNMEKGAEKTEFTIEELPKYIPMFYYLAGYDEEEYQAQEAVNIKAAEAMGELHDQLKELGYGGHDLEVYLVRLLFLLFAEDTNIFDKNAFRNYIQAYTNEDGSDLAGQLAQLFQVLDTEKERRYRNINEDLKKLPYVNGGLFREQIRMPVFTKEMRDTILKLTQLDWGEISPSIFGSMFQSVMDAEARRALGAHYTSERNILKVIKPLFIDDLRKEFRAIMNDNNRDKNLKEFQEKLASLKILDPACGCGNFLIVAYRELRMLELEVLEALHPADRRQLRLDIADMCKVNVAQFYGIEIEEFPARIAQVGMWLTDHQMNMKVGAKFGQALVRLPLEKSATIKHSVNNDNNGNALTTDWGKFVGEGLSYIIGNPPFKGYKQQNKREKEELKSIGIESRKVDYVAGWYFKAAQLIKGTNIRVAFVSTNSIVQGEQVNFIWKPLKSQYNIDINFAYRTFKWSNEAARNAAVHCVIIGFSDKEISPEWKYLESEEHTSSLVPHINGYLTNTDDVFLENRRTALWNCQRMVNGSEPRDDDNLMFTPQERDELLKETPEAQPFIRRILNSDDFIDNNYRYCLWIDKKKTDEVAEGLAVCRKSAILRERLRNCAAERDRMKQKQAHKAKDTPYLFVSARQPENEYLLIPVTSSENRKYIPIDYVSSDIIATNACSTIENASLYTFGVLTSGMHMAWVDAVCGRLEMRYRYSNTLVYNNFPWPSPSDAQMERIVRYAQEVRAARANYPAKTLAELYDPLMMPVDLQTAHRKLDNAVEDAYGQRFSNDVERVKHLFELYIGLINPPTALHGEPAV